jgi:hypothetical protein
MSTFTDRGCHVFSVTDPYCRILGFVDGSRYFFFQVAPQLFSRGWVDPVPDPLLLRKFGSAGNRTRTYIYRHASIIVLQVWTLQNHTFSFYPVKYREIFRIQIKHIGFICTLGPCHPFDELDPQACLHSELVWNYESCRVGRTPGTRDHPFSQVATYTGQHTHRNDADISPQWDSNPRSQCTRGPNTSRALRFAATISSVFHVVYQVYVEPR